MFFSTQPRLDRAQSTTRLSKLLELMGEAPATLLKDAKTGRHADANAAAVFQRQLEYVEREVYRVQYPFLKGREIIPVDYSIPSGAESFLYRMFDKIGEAQLVTDWSTDFPNVSITGQEYANKIYHIGDSYYYTTQDLRAAAMAGLPLQTELAETAREAIERKLDQIAATGMPSVGMYGFANNPAVEATQIVTLTNGFGTKTGAQIQAELMKLWVKVFTGSPNQEEIDSLAVSPEVYATFARPVNDYNQENLLDWLKRNTPFKNITPWTKLRTAGAAGTPRIVAYRKDPKTAKLVIPQEFEQTSPQARGFAFSVACHLSTGGVVVRQPLNMAYADNVLA